MSEEAVVQVVLADASDDAAAELQALLATELPAESVVVSRAQAVRYGDSVVELVRVALPWAASIVGAAMLERTVDKIVHALQSWRSARREKAATERVAIIYDANGNEIRRIRIDDHPQPPRKK